MNNFQKHIVELTEINSTNFGVIEDKIVSCREASDCMQCLFVADCSTLRMEWLLKKGE